MKLYNVNIDALNNVSNDEFTRLGSSPRKTTNFYTRLAAQFAGKIKTGKNKLGVNTYQVVKYETEIFF